MSQKAQSYLLNNMDTLQLANTREDFNVYQNQQELNNKFPIKNRKQHHSHSNFDNKFYEDNNLLPSNYLENFYTDKYSNYSNNISTFWSDNITQLPQFDNVFYNIPNDVGEGKYHTYSGNQAPYNEMMLSSYMNTLQQQRNKIKYREDKRKEEKLKKKKEEIRRRIMWEKRKAWERRHQNRDTVKNAVTSTLILTLLANIA